MSPDTIKALQETLSPVFTKLGIGAEKGWDVVVKQQKVNALQSILFLCIELLVALFVMHPWLEWLLAPSTCEGWCDATAADVGLAAWGAVAIGLSVAAVIAGSSIVTQLVNPEYAALDYFLSLIKKND